MATSYENLREYLDSDYARLSDAEVEALMRRNGMSAEAMEGFFDDLKKVATSVGQVALRAAPSVISVAAPLVGTAIGGPIGGMIGGSLGSLASGAIASATGQKAPAAPGAAPAAGPAGPIAGGIGQLVGGLTGGSPAAGSLVQSLLTPQTIQALGSMVLGTLGKDSVPVAGRDVPVSGFINLLKSFLGNAEAEYHALQASADAALPEYLQGSAGLGAGDSASDAFRAQRLQELLESERRAGYDAEAAESGESEIEALEAEYDAAELLEMEMEAYEYEFEEA
jgi:hypothetical protein